MRKLADSVKEIVRRKCESSEQKPIAFNFRQSPPSIQTHLEIPKNNENYGILTARKDRYLFQPYNLLY